MFLEDLDEKRLEEFLKDLEEFRAKVELRKKEKNCLDTLEENQRKCRKPEERH